MFFFCLGTQDGLVEAVTAIEDLKDEHKTELVEMLDCYFDPDKQAIKPVLKHRNRSRRGTYFFKTIWIIPYRYIISIAGQKENIRPRNKEGGDRRENENERPAKDRKSSNGETDNKTSPDSTSKSLNRRHNRRRRSNAEPSNDTVVAPQTVSA